MICPYCGEKTVEREGSTLAGIPEWTCKDCGASFWAEPGNEEAEE